PVSAPLFLQLPRPPPTPPPLPYTTLFRSRRSLEPRRLPRRQHPRPRPRHGTVHPGRRILQIDRRARQPRQLQPRRERRAEGFDVDRKSTRLNSSHVSISYAVFCLKKKNPHSITPTTEEQVTATAAHTSPDVGLAADAPRRAPQSVWSKVSGRARGQLL